MGFYNERILPHLIAVTMRHGELNPYRERIVGAAEGRVLEVGVGAGANLPFYGSGVSDVFGLDPSKRLLEMAAKAGPLHPLEASAEAIPLEADSVDTVVTTWTLCSIPDAHAALTEMRRVLKPGGRLLFVEHGLSPDKRVRWFQNRITPIWRCLAGGCHMNRPIDLLIREAGWKIEKIDTGYLRGPNPATYMYEGSARPG
ncbi:class I SAM-dependent methyltransferase [Dichotomicrobium thermohalophilum]|uniref:Methyltransferase family protein n=1 Tax=Dichotomicrobium thermohalophilum TaxID=933063 RepID=A0A397QDN2_9HYPH|nr:class I SAM-dependent methyltransferase [Dichotomicrobium thermohalophilum]RIA56361.1 methyltransferase family protein [Dichotomicrobium thermohalophilum]